MALPRLILVVLVHADVAPRGGLGGHIAHQGRKPAGDIQIFADVSRSNELAEVLECARIFLQVSEIRGASQGLELGGQM